MKPLLITDCDEVLLHMVRHFATWLDESHDIDLDLTRHNFMEAIRPRDGSQLSEERMWGLVNGFFPAEMGRQTLVPNAREALEALSAQADIVVLTNLMDDWQQDRVKQLDQHGIVVRVETNQGGKGRAVARLLDEYAPSVAVFVDDLPQHHESVAKRAPDVFRLHMVAEPLMAVHVGAAPHAHARIDDWLVAQDWIEARFAAGVPATAQSAMAD